MRARQFEKGKATTDGPPQQQVLGIGHWPYRKGPVLYYGNEYCAELILTFGSEEKADAFMDLLTDFFDVPAIAESAS